jgi:hypothetical protein
MDGWEFRSPNSKFPAVHREEHRSNPSSYKVCVNDDMPCMLTQTQTRSWAMAAERYPLHSARGSRSPYLAMVSGQSAQHLGPAHAIPLGHGHCMS